MYLPNTTCWHVANAVATIAGIAPIPRATVQRRTGTKMRGGRRYKAIARGLIHSAGLKHSSRLKPREMVLICEKNSIICPLIKEQVTLHADYSA